MKTVNNEKIAFILFILFFLIVIKTYKSLSDENYNICDENKIKKNALKQIKTFKKDKHNNQLGNRIKIFQNADLSDYYIPKQIEENEENKENKIKLDVINCLMSSFLFRESIKYIFNDKSIIPLYYTKFIEDFAENVMTENFDINKSIVKQLGTQFSNFLFVICVLNKFNNNLTEKQTKTLLYKLNFAAKSKKDFLENILYYLNKETYGLYNYEEQIIKDSFNKINQYILDDFRKTVKQSIIDYIFCGYYIIYHKCSKCYYHKISFEKFREITKFSHNIVDNITCKNCNTNIKHNILKSVFIYPKVIIDYKNSSKEITFENYRYKLISQCDEFSLFGIIY